MPIERLSRLIRGNPDLAAIRARIDVVGQLQERYRSLAPETLASSSRVCALEGTTVVISADNAPVAAALRALAPRLLAGLNAPAPPGKNSLKIKRDQELTALRVEVQVRAPPPVRRPPARGALPVERLAEVASRLSDSPLKTALERIVAGQAKSSTRSKR